LAVPQLSFGAMENWGLVIYRDYVLLFDEKVYPLSSKQNIAVDVAHELAHQVGNISVQFLMSCGGYIKFQTYVQYFSENFFVLWQLP
jgi:hypothetical protein